MWSKTEIKEITTHMLNRPQMWAQSVASFEDQIRLLAQISDKNLAGEFSHFVFQTTKTCAPLSSKYTTFEGMSEVLKIFARKHGLYEDSSK